MNRPIKILYLITDLGRGGAERSITDLAIQFKNRENVTCVIGSLFTQNAFPELEEKIRIEYLDYNLFSLRKKNYTKKYHDLVSSFKPDIIHSNRFLAEFLTAEKVYPNIKYVCHGRDNMVQMQNFSVSTLFNKRRLLNYIEKTILIFRKYKKINTHFVANSEHTDAYFKCVLLKKDRKNVSIIYNAVDLSKFYFNQKRSINKSRKIKLINIGSFQPKKNQQFLIDIAILLKKAKIDFEFNLLGDGVEFEKVKEKIIKSDLEAYVKLRGVQYNVEEWLKDSDIYIHSACYEPFGIVLIEAMASGLPLITLDGKGNRVLIEEGKNGFMIYDQDPQLFAAKILKLIEEPKLYEEMSEYSKRFVQQFDIKKKADEYVKFYNKILNVN